MRQASKIVSRASARSDKEFSMSYLRLSECADVLPVSLSVPPGVGERVVACAITREALHDLGFHHGFRASGQELVRALAPQIERLAKAKYRAGRIEENGELVIRSVDLLRYGFRGGANPSHDPVQSVAVAETSTSADLP
jgi:hypothetical protein